MLRRLPSLRALTAFEAAARRGNFTRAADDLALTQGAISRQVQSLEADLGVGLFDRGGGRLVLTHDGARLLHELAPLLDGLQTSIDGLRRAGGRDGSVVIAAYPTFASRWLTKRRLAWEARPGAARVRVETIVSNAAFDPDRFDLGIVQGVPPFPGLVAAPLLPERLVVAGAPALVAALPGGLSALATAPYLRHVTRPMSLRIWSESAGEVLADPADGPVFDRYDMMIEAAMDGHGIGVFPDVLIARELAAGLLVPAHPHVAAPAAGYHLVASAGRPPRPAAAAFRDWLLSTAGTG